MSRWMFCGSDMDVMNYGRENDNFFRNVWSGNHADFSQSHHKKHQNIQRKRSQKISLRDINSPLKRKLTVETTESTIKNIPQVQIQTRIVTQTRLLQCRSQKYFPVPRIQYVKSPPPKLNLQAAQDYCLNIPAPTVPIHHPKPYNIKINYINPIADVKEIKVTPKIQIETTKALKRINTMPTKTQSVIFEPQNKDGKSGLILAKSMDYTEPVKNINFKSTQNLHEIQCIKAQSIADSEEMQDQFSVVLSPMDDVSLDKRDLAQEIWGDFNIKESSQKQSLKATSGAETASQQTIFHL